MNATWSTAKAGASHRPAVPLHVDHIDREAVESPFGEAQSNNKRLISHSHDVAGEPHHFGRAPVRMEHGPEAASCWQIPVVNMAEAALCAGA